MTFTGLNPTDDEIWLRESRTESDVIKVKVDDCAPIFLHVDNTKVPHFAVSSPGKYKDKAIGNLLEALVEQINSAIAARTGQ